ncbi:MAG: hypothetical protein IJK97_12660 [Thermoguttaceae bacterium]|nr:hypothetical protein [Thermoguttaceae bacterium]
MAELYAKLTLTPDLNTDFHGLKGFKGFFQEDFKLFSLKIRANLFNPWKSVFK